MQFGILLPASRGEVLAQHARMSDSAGFDLITVGDMPLVFRELYVSLAVLALNTTRARIGPMVTNVVTRHPSVTAGAIASVDELSGGRAFLGLGSGDSALYAIGQEAVRLKPFEEAVTGLKRLLSGDTMQTNGKSLRLEWIQRRVPVYITAEGPKMLQLAGRIADGVVVGMGLTPEAIEKSFYWLRQGVEQSGRSLEELDVWFFARVSIAEDRARAVDEIKVGLAASAKRVFRFNLKAKGVPEALVSPLQELQARYDYSGHMVPGHPLNSRLTDELALTDYLAQRFAIAGPPEDCREQIRSLEALGVKKLLFSGNLPDPRDFIQNIAAEIIRPLSTSND